MADYYTPEYNFYYIDTNGNRQQYQLIEFYNQNKIVCLEL